MTKMFFLPVFSLLVFILIKLKEVNIMILDILGYVFGIGFIVFGISALVLWGNEIYKIISKSNKRVSYKKSIYCAVIAVICAIALIIMANVF